MKLAHSMTDYLWLPFKVGGQVTNFSRFFLVKEDSPMLFWFHDKNERALFRVLIKVWTVIWTLKWHMLSLSQYVFEELITNVQESDVTRF